MSKPAQPASTIYRVLRRHDLVRLSHMDRPSDAPIRRYERIRPGELVHDNHFSYRDRLFNAALAENRIIHKYGRPDHQPSNQPPH